MTSSISAENYAWLQRYVYDQSGIVLDHAKQYLLETRLSPLVRDHKLTNIDSLCALMRATASPPGLKTSVLEAMTTNETLFYRDSGVFDAIRDSVLPQIVESRRLTRTLSIWSAASSTGQEIYSIAMMLTDAGLGDWRIRLLGTDISEQVLERARVGRFLQIEVNRGLPAAALLRHFERHGREWELRPAIRQMVEFRRFDLRGPMASLGNFDFVLCRNVLIYFDVPTKSAVLKEIARTLPKGGWLLLGAAETILGIDCPFERAVSGKHVFYRRV